MVANIITHRHTPISQPQVPCYGKQYRQMSAANERQICNEDQACLLTRFLSALTP